MLCKHRNHARAALLCVIALGAAGTADPGHAATQTAVTLSGFADDASGYSYDVDARVTLNERWTVSAGGGRSTTSLSGSDFNGTAWRVAGALQSSRFGARIGARNWTDSDRYKSSSVFAEASVEATEAITLTAIADRRRLEVGYDVVGLLGRVSPQSAAFDAAGYGAEISWYGAAWGLSARAMAYDYGSSLDRVIAASRAPTTRVFPRLQSLVDSVLTRSAGVSDRELGLSVQRSFARSGLRLDLAQSRDAITAGDVQSISVSYRYSFSPRLDIEATAGTSDGESSSPSIYGGLALTFRN